MYVNKKQVFHTITILLYVIQTNTLTYRYTEPKQHLLIYIVTSYIIELSDQHVSLCFVENNIFYVCTHYFVL